MGTILALHLASAHPESVNVLVLFAPLLDFASRTSVLFDSRWGQRIMRLFLGGPYIRIDPENEGHARYWYEYYRIESLWTLKAMKNELLNDEVYSRIYHPVFTGYYENDDVVSVSAITDMENRLGTPAEHREFKAFPDADAHVITSEYRTDIYPQVHKAVTAFLEQYVSTSMESSN